MIKYSSCVAMRGLHEAVLFFGEILPGRNLTWKIIAFKSQVIKVPP